MLIKKEHRQFIRNVKAIPGRFQHALVTVDIHQTKVWNVVLYCSTCTVTRKISLLKYVKIREQFDEEVMELVDVGVPNLWEHFKDEVSMACDEMCGKKRKYRGEG